MSHQTTTRDTSTTPNEPDGSVTIDLADEIDRMRYRCPNGHTSFAPTNNHLWCKSCADAAQRGHDIEAEHYTLHDARTGEEIAWSDIELIET